MKLLSFLPLLVSGFAPPSSAAADYHERLDLQPLAPSSLLASFNFRGREASTAFESHSYRLFPRSLGQILQHAGTRELHLRFTLGRWDAESWGARPWRGAKEGGTGVELWAWVDADGDREADARWTILTNALSGLFCASLNFIDSTRTVRPVLSFQPDGDHPNSTLPRLHLLHGTLPREPVCTENLTPFLKLLPCKGKAGISTLLDGHKLFDASWQSMSIDVRPVCPEGSPCSLEIEQTVDMVIDIERFKRYRDNPIPKPVPVDELVCDTSKPYASNEACYPLDHLLEPSWSLNEIFGRRIKGVCPLAGEGDDVTPVCINVAHDRQAFASPGSVEHRRPDGSGRCFHFSGVEEFDLVLPKQTDTTPIRLPTPALYAERTFTGYGQERGGVQTILRNPSPDHAVEFVYLESLPWFMRTYLHTLSTTVVRDAPSTRQRAQGKADDAEAEHKVLRDLYYRPALDRHRPTHLEMLLSVPANASVILKYDFEKAILRYTEYPPDANRGFDIPAAIIRLTSGAPPPRAAAAPPSSSSTQHHHPGSASDNDRREPIYLRTTTLLLSLPTPDFSMPYNVIILTSTVMALTFGSVFNLLVRRFVGTDDVEDLNLRVLVRRLAGRVAALVQQLQQQRRRQAVARWWKGGRSLASAGRDRVGQDTSTEAQHADVDADANETRKEQ